MLSAFDWKINSCMKKNGLIASIQKNKVSLIVLASGLFVRLILPFLGHNYDFESFWIVGEITAQFKNVYVETARYNYGPVWFSILFLFHQLAGILPGDAINTFRWCIVLCLAVTDIGILFLVKKRIGLLAAVLFYLNPVAMIITGYHNQFDNLAILLALAACLMLEKQKSLGIDRFTIGGLVLLGLSITTKHLFIFFPIWLMLRALFRREWTQAAISILIPYSLFFLSFLPFFGEGGVNGIISNVFLYKSFNNAPFFQVFIPAAVQSVSSPMLWLLFFMAVFGVSLRKTRPFILAAIYLGVLVTFAPAMTNQYLAIPSVFIAIFPNPFFVIFTLLSFYHLLVNSDGLHLQAVREIFYPESYHFFYIIGIIALAAGMLLFVTQYNKGNLIRLLTPIAEKIGLKNPSGEE